MYTRGGMNYEYANPVAFNINNKNIESMSHAGSPTIRPVPINYQGYTSQNTSVVSFNNQNNINSSDNSNFYIQRYKNPENAKSSLKYSTTQYIPKNKIDERNEMINIRKHRNYINDNNGNINNRPNQNSVALPANYSSYNRLPINSYYANGKDHTTQNNEIKLTYDKIDSLNKPERIKSMTTPNNMEVDNPNYEEKLQKTKNVYIQDPQKNNNFEIKMKRDEKISNLNKQYLITKEKDETTLLDNINHSRNVVFAKSPKNNTNSPIYDTLGTNKKLRIQNQFGNERRTTAKNEIEYMGKRERDLYNKVKGGIENRKGEYLYKENNDMKDTKKLNIKEVQKYSMSLKNDEKKNERKMNILKNKKGNGKSIDNDKKKLECIVSMNFKEDAFDLKNGLKAFKNIIIIDRNNVIKKWNGYEWIKLENDFHFFIKARYDNKGNIWLINNSYEILKLKDNKYKKYGNIANEEIVDIGFDKKNILWCINRKGDLLKWDKTQWKRIKYSGFHKLISLAFDIKGNLWGLNSKRILALWNTKNKCWDEKIINSELKISSMDFDKDGKIWAISNNGALLTYVSNQWINFGYVCLDELISISFKI